MSFGTYRQYDSRWGKKNYNGSSTYATAACGPTSCANILYAINPKITPLTTGNYMKSHGYAIRNNGTAWNGIPACLKAFGAKDVRQVDKMADVFKYCAKGYVGVFLFRGGSRGGVTWTTSGHYVAITDYKVANGKHYFKTFDSGGRKHDGWYCYETQMKGLVPRIWLCKVAPEKTKKPTTKYSGTLPKPTLKKGSKGDNVVKLQKFLTWYGIKTNSDGDFGSKTEASVLQFQFNEGLTQDGIFGKKSYAAAQKYVETKAVSKPASTTASTPTPTAPTQSKLAKAEKCIDVSYWQGKISVENWKKIKKTCKYAICRASYTSQSKFALSKDSTFATNFKNAQAAGLKVGAYHYSQAITIDEAKKEAKYLCNILKDYKVDFYVVCDFEYGGRLSSKIGKKASDIANAFCDVVKANGYTPCIYANTSTLNNALTNPKYPVWVAQYASSCSYKDKKVMWQYTSSGKVDGISAKNTNNGNSKVDLSYVYALPAIKPIPEPTPQPKPVEQPKAEPVGYSGKFPTLNTNAKIINGLAYRMCYPYGTSQKKYTFKDGKPRDAYKKGLDKIFPNHGSWPNKRQKVGACCDILTAVCLGYVGVKVKKDLKNQLVDMPKMKDQLKSNGHYKAADFKLGDVVQRGRKDKSGHTYIICELVNGKRYIANAHYKHLNGCYAVMDSVVKTETPSKWKYYKCYTVQGAARVYYQKGDYGYDVMYIQKFLNWYKIPCTADGDFGAKTEAAVKTFQEAMGLTSSGKVGETTIAYMKKVKK